MTAPEESREINLKALIVIHKGSTDVELAQLGVYPACELCVRTPPVPLQSRIAGIGGLDKEGIQIYRPKSLLADPKHVRVFPKLQCSTRRGQKYS